ncbi:MAG: hypothetical protein K2N94_00585 [Lachnospiraceae bacterium]|nr:hypothetical protein [Lachnospiraceae bacterium]
MKKKAILAAMMASALLAEGCLLDTYSLTEEEQDIIAEYAAAVLLRHDEDYTEALLSPTPVPSPTPAPSPTPDPLSTPTPGASGSGASGNHGAGKEPEDRVQTDLNGVFGLEGLTVQYDGYDTAGRFEEKEYSYVVKAGEGKQLVKVYLVLTNTAGIDQSFDFSTMNMKYELSYGKNKRIQPKITLLSGDMNLPVELAAGGRTTGCIVFETSADADLSSGALVIRRDNYECSLPLK